MMIRIEIFKFSDSQVVKNEHGQEKSLTQNASKGYIGKSHLSGVRINPNEAKVTKTKLDEQEFHVEGNVVDG